MTLRGSAMNMAGALCLTFVLCTATRQACGADSDGTWTLVGQTTTDRTETGAVSLNGKIYVLGSGAGILGLPNLPLAQEFDPATGRWRDLAPLPQGVSHLGVTTLDGKIYVAGGFGINAHRNPLDQFLEYDPATDKWTSAAPLPSHAITWGASSWPMASSTSSAAGPPATRPTALQLTMSMIRPRTNGLRGESLRAPHSEGGVAALRGLILYFGGDCNDPKASAAFDELQAYEPKTDTWKPLSKAPIGLHGPGTAALGDAVYSSVGTHVTAIRPRKPYTRSA